VAADQLVVLAADQLVLLAADQLVLVAADQLVVVAADQLVLVAADQLVVVAADQLVVVAADQLVFHRIISRRVGLVCKQKFYMILTEFALNEIHIFFYQFYPFRISQIFQYYFPAFMFSYRICVNLFC